MPLMHNLFLFQLWVLSLSAQGTNLNPLFSGTESEGKYKMLLSQLLMYILNSVSSTRLSGRRDADKCTMTSFLDEWIRERTLFIVFANFQGVNTLTIATFKLPMI